MATQFTARVAAAEAAPHARMLTTIAWIAGPTVIFVGWFLMSIIAGSQRPGGIQDGTPIALLFLFALITSVPLIIVSLIGGITTMLSSTLRTQRVMNLMALFWNGVTFAIYFGLFGIVGTLTEDGFPVTSTTVSALIPIALITMVLPIVLYLVGRRTLIRAEAAPAPRPPDVYDI